MTALLLALVIAAPLPDEELPNPYLLQAKELYEQLDFEKCMQRIKQAAAWKGSSVHDLRDIELYGALCALNLGQKNEAAERFKLALRIDEDLELPEFASPKAVKLFLYVKRKIRQGTVPPMPDEDLPADTPVPAKLEPKPGAREPEVVQKSGPVFDVSKHKVPFVLGGLSLAALAGGVGLGVNSKSLETQARQQVFESDYLAMRGLAQNSAIAADVLFGVAGVLAIGALVAVLVGP